MTGGADIDYLQLLGSAGINAGGNTTRLMGNDGDDRFFVQGTQPALTIDGGVGADRYYFAQNAAKSLFITDDGGYFDDDATPRFNLFSGTLAGFSGAVTVNTGPGGDGGTRDIVYASSADSTGGLITNHDGDARLTGLGMSGHIDVHVPVPVAPDDPPVTAFVLVGLSGGDDSFRVKSLGSPFDSPIMMMESPMSTSRCMIAPSGPAKRATTSPPNAFSRNEASPFASATTM